MPDNPPASRPTSRPPCAAASLPAVHTPRAARRTPSRGCTTISMGSAVVQRWAAPPRADWPATTPAAAPRPRKTPPASTPPAPTMASADRRIVLPLDTVRHSCILCRSAPHLRPARRIAPFSPSAEERLPVSCRSVSLPRRCPFSADFALLAPAPACAAPPASAPVPRVSRRQLAQTLFQRRRQLHPSQAVQMQIFAQPQIVAYSRWRFAGDLLQSAPAASRHRLKIRHCSRVTSPLAAACTLVQPRRHSFAPAPCRSKCAADPAPATAPSAALAETPPAARFALSTAVRMPGSPSLAPPAPRTAPAHSPSPPAPPRSRNTPGSCSIAASRSSG